ncbi:unnamed protein product [Caenorhabditis brenneri]
MVANSILVEEVTNKEVVVSTNCLKTYKAEDGVKLVVQVSEIEYKELFMALGDGHDVIKHIDGALDIAKGCLLIGSFILPACAPALLALAGVGTAIQIFLHIIPDHRQEQLVLKLKEVEEVIHEVQKLANEKFTDLKLFITESQFDVDIISETTVLMKLMRNCMVHQNKESVDNFRHVYKRRPPLRLAYILMSFLEQKSTNPLVMAMETESQKTFLKSLKTFKKWEDIIKGVLGQLLIIEGFASGLMKNENAYNWDRMIERSQQVSSVLYHLEKEYKLTDYYYYEFEEWLKTYAESNINVSNAQKADAIRTQLETYPTCDTFYVIVFDHTNDQNHLYFPTKPENKDRLIQYVDSVGTDYIIFGTVKFDDIQKKINDARALMENYKYLTYERTVAVPEEIKNEKYISKAFYVLIGGLKEEIRWARCPELEQGPGWISDSFDFGGTCKRRLLVAPF